MNKSPLEEYKKCCKLASTSNLVFSSFRHRSEYTFMLDHVTYEQGLEYLKIVEDINPELLTHMDGFRKNDAVGSPNICDYGKYGIVCPSTLRYIKILADIIHKFGSLDGMDIFEFGGGYGGQCRIISEVYNFKSYTIVDFPEVKELVNKYLSEFGVPNAKCITTAELEDKDYDLFISNFAFTEIDKELQNMYMDKVVNRCKRGYVTCNVSGAMIRENIISNSHPELFSKLKHPYTVSKETPHTSDDNCLLLW